MYNYIVKNKKKVLVIPLVLYWILLFIGTSIPSDNLSLDFALSDKLKHFLAYFGLAFLLGLNLYFQKKYKKIALHFLIYTFIICAVYGAFDEIHQIFIPNRSAELLDWLADLSGAILGSLAASFTVIKLKKSSGN